jgi:hypothetical protein
LQTAWSDLPWLFSLTQNIAVHPAAVEMEERHGSIMRSGPNVGKHKSYAYRFETPDRVIVFTGDTGPAMLSLRLPMVPIFW